MSTPAGWSGVALKCIEFKILDKGGVVPKKIKKRTKKSEEELELSGEGVVEGGAPGEEGPVLLDEDGMPIRQEEYDEVANFGDIVVNIPE